MFALNYLHRNVIRRWMFWIRPLPSVPSCAHSSGGGCNNHSKVGNRAHAKRRTLRGTSSPNATLAAGLKSTGFSGYVHYRKLGASMV